MRAIITHFDGDPFTLNAWLTLYGKYWRGECNKIYMTIVNKGLPAEIIDYEVKLLKKFPEIEYAWINHKVVPETANAETLKSVKEEYIGFIESDGLIYGSGVVDQCFRLLESGQDIIAPPWELIDEPYFNGDLGIKGFMRCFFFAKKSILDRVEMDFMPRTVVKGTRLDENYVTEKDVALDCFGWISWQLALLRPKITLTPNNVLGPDSILSPYSNFKWVHIRQMSSSALGMGGDEFSVWVANDMEKLRERVLRLFNEGFPDGPAEYTYIKATAFKLLFMDMTEDLGQFGKDYRQVLDLVIDYYNIPKERIYEIKGFYKALFQL